MLPAKLGRLKSGAIWLSATRGIFSPLPMVCCPSGGQRWYTWRCIWRSSHDIESDQSQVYSLYPLQGFGAKRVSVQVMGTRSGRTALRLALDRFRIRRLPPSLVLGSVAAVALPLVLHPGAYQAFEPPRAMLLRGLALGALVLAAWTGARTGRNLPQIPPLVIPALLLGQAFLASKTLAANGGVGLWGSYERQYGLLMWTGWPRWLIPGLDRPRLG